MNIRRRITLYERLQCFWVNIRDVFLRLATLNYTVFTKVFRFLPPGYITWTSRLRARKAYVLAVKRVPAYRIFLQETPGDTIPETDKENYIKKFSIEERCMDGKIPKNSVTIDESSGSTGTPYNWIRTLRERKESHLFTSYFAKYCFGDKFDITINAFSLGAWATGLNMGVALERNGIMKNTGPDIPKIFSTLKFFGPQYRYLILGYPPFLKQLIDRAKKEKFPLEQYHFQALVGGEGMSEGLRDYLLPYFKEVYSGYGATDLELGIAGESPISVAIRRLARENKKVQEALFGRDSRLPMVFQYNPLMHYIEVNKEGELIFTITRNSMLSPRIRYNVHDQGGIASYCEMRGKLAELGFDISTLEKKSPFHLMLPFVWVFGRSDFTISIMGANIYPEDIDRCVYQHKKIAEITRSFCQGVAEDGKGNVRPAFYFEIEIAPTKALAEEFRHAMIEGLRNLNADFAEAWGEYKETLIPEIHLHRIGEGPFMRKQGQIKQKRMLKK